MTNTCNTQILFHTFLIIIFLVTASSLIIRLLLFQNLELKLWSTSSTIGIKNSIREHKKLQYCFLPTFSKRNVHLYNRIQQFLPKAKHALVLWKHPWTVTILLFSKFPCSSSLKPCVMLWRFVHRVFVCSLTVQTISSSTVVYPRIGKHSLIYPWFYENQNL